MAITLDGSNVNTTGLINSATAVAATSGTTISFTGIPSTTKRVTVMYQGVSMSGTSNPRTQLGTSGGIVTTGYVGGTQYLGIGTASLSAGFDINNNFGNAGNLFTGHLFLTLIGSNTWICSSTIFSTGAGTQPNLMAGYVALGGTLTQLRIISVNGTDTFDAGSVNILYE